MKSFNKILCINLPRRTDRRDESIQEFKDVGILDKVIWVPGVEDANPYRGFNLAQKNTLEMASAWDNVLILEDDIRFLRPHLRWLWKDLEEYPWDMLYLGATLRSPLKRISSHLYRAENVWTTHAIVYRKKMIRTILDLFPADLLDPLSPGFVPFDEWLRTDIQPNFNCLICNPMVAVQRPSYSDLEGRFASYNMMGKQSNDYMNEQL